MMHIFRDLQLTETDLDQLPQLMKTIVLEKQDYFVREGNVCRQLAFLSKGILRSFYVKDNGEEITDCIMFEGQLVTAYSSFITGRPAFENIQAITDCELQILDRNDLYSLYEQNIRWANTGRILGEQEYVMMEQRTRSFQQYTAKERYEELVRKHPRMIQQVPLQYLASYLGITPQHLSRLRKN